MDLPERANSELQIFSEPSLSLQVNNEFLTITNESLEKINNDLKLVEKPLKFIAKSTSHTDRKIASLQMLYPASATYEVIKEVLALIERKYQALQENIYKQEKEKLELEEKYIELESLKKDDLSEKLYDIKKRKLELEISEYKTNIKMMSKYIENAIKELGMLLETYKEITKNKNVENFTEEDFEKEEFKARIMLIFRQAFRDLLAHGNLGMGSLEGFEQIGIHPLIGKKITVDYYNYCMKRLEQGNDHELTYKNFMKWLSNNAEQFKDKYKDVFDVLGIDTLVNKDYVYTGEKE